mmetsp:Transcript_10139/g.20753  ORF Transcript_10139/g.20753 Transcript_10139/m.20753 type:complete len:283 (+) Transcript_10139:5150-5998(+)
MAKRGWSLFLNLALGINVSASHAVYELGLGILDKAKDSSVEVTRLLRSELEKNGSLEIRRDDSSCLVELEDAGVIGRKAERGRKLRVVAEEEDPGHGVANVSVAKVQRVRYTLDLGERVGLLMENYNGSHAPAGKLEVLLVSARGHDFVVLLSVSSCNQGGVHDGEIELGTRRDYARRRFNREDWIPVLLDTKDLESGWDNRLIPNHKLPLDLEVVGTIDNYLPERDCVFGGYNVGVLGDCRKPHLKPWLWLRCIYTLADLAHGVRHEYLGGGWADAANNLC